MAHPFENAAEFDPFADVVVEDDPFAELVVVGDPLADLVGDLLAGLVILGRVARRKCPHGRQKNYCRSCGGTRVCPHSANRHYCRKCTDPKAVSVRQWMRDSKAADRKHRRANDLDRGYLQVLIEKAGSRCFYPDCRRPLRWTAPGPDLATLERLNNDVGHVKGNVVIACQDCNNRHHGEGFRHGEAFYEVAPGQFLNEDGLNPYGAEEQAAAAAQAEEHEEPAEEHAPGPDGL